MSDVAHPRSPFAGVPTRDVARDVVAAVALLVALPLPWDATLRGSDLLWVVLTTVVALLLVAAPYAWRAGLVPEGWAKVATPRARLVGLAPVAFVALLYVVLDLFAVGDGGVGAGLALGLAGAVLAAALPSTRGAAVSALVVAVAAVVVTPLTTVAAGSPWPVVVGALLSALLVLGMLWLTVGAFLRHHDDAAGLVLVVVGGAVALELALLGGGAQHGWVESLHADRYGLLLLPVVAAFAVPVALDRAATWAGEPAGVGAARWVRVAVRTLELAMVVAAFVTLVALVRLVAAAAADVPGFGFGVEPVLRLIVGVLVVVIAFLARRALVRDARTAHATAVGAACVIGVLGLVILVARAGVGTRSHVEELLLALAIPATVLVALLVPPSVRELVGSGQPAPGAGAQATGGWQATGPVASGSFGEVAPGQQPAVQETAVQQPVAQQPPAQQPPAQQQPAAPQSSVQETAVQQPVADPGSRWRGTWAARTDATQQMAPVEAASADGDGPVQRPDQTQVLQAMADVPGSRWTPEQALAPTTPLEDLAQIVQEAPHLRPHVAANPSTYPALLDWLGALGDPAVDAALRTRR